MLSKTKSKQIHILKYTLLIPLVCTMLIYTSSYAQEKLEVIEETMQIEDSELSDKELRQKYYDQIVEMKKNGKSFMEIHEFTMPDLDKYISSRTDYYKYTAYMQYIFNDTNRKTSDNEEVNEGIAELSQSTKSKINRTYEEYVAWKQTDEAKEIWENNTRDGVLRLLIQDAGNMTDEEEQKMFHKLDMIERDDYFNKLLVVAMDGSTKMILQDPKSTKTVSENVIVEEIIEEIEVPFAVVDQVPTMVTCQGLTTNVERKACMSKNIAIHVNENFNVDLAKELGLVGKQRISVIFKIDTQGKVIDVRARAPHPKLEEEAKRVINLLPQFKPGKQKGKKVTVPYSLPILFQVKGDVDSNLSDEDVIEEIIEQETNDKNVELTEVPYSVVDTAPVFSTCQDFNSEKERKTCTSDKVSSFVSKNFNTDLAKQLNIKGIQRVSVAFKIDKEGSVTDVRARAPHPKLEEEAKRVIKLLPQFIPGKHNGKLIIVPYSLPIVFQVH